MNKNFEYKRTWFVVFAVGIVSFSVFYGVFYQHFLASYNGMWLPLKMSLNCDASDLICKDDFVVDVYSPKFLSGSDFQTFILEINNMSGTPILVKPIAYLDRAPSSSSSDNCENEPTNMLDMKDGLAALSRYDGGDSDSSSVLLPPLGIGITKVSLPYSGGVIEKNEGYALAVFLRGVSYEMDTSESANEEKQRSINCYFRLKTTGGNEIEVSSIKNAMYNVMEKILLPPWLNVVLVFQSGFWVWMLEAKILGFRDQNQLSFWRMVYLFLFSLLFFFGSLVFSGCVLRYVLRVDAASSICVLALTWFAGIFVLFLVVMAISSPKERS